MENQARRLRVGTASGSTYLFDRDAMTWRRFNVNLGHEDIRGMAGVAEGALDTFPDPVEVGQPLRFYIGSPRSTWITTTPVVNVEDVT